MGNMLIRFRASNFRSIDEPVELSMVAVDRDRDAAREAPRLGESLLTRAAIYGPNASGKSNVLAALAWLRDAVRDSLRAWEDSVPVDTFAFREGPQQPSEFMLDLLIDGVRFEYILELDEERVHYEALYHYPERRRRMVFEREGMDLSFNRGMGSPSGIRELLTPTTLALSAARKLRHEPAYRFAVELDTMSVLGHLPTPRLGWFSTDPMTGEELMREIFDQEHSSASRTTVQFQAQALALLKLADLGIENVVVETRDIPAPAGDAIKRVRAPRLVHRGERSDQPLMFRDESEGTKAWFRLIGHILPALEYGAPIIFDEIDASLHPTLTAELLKMFADRSANPHGAQLIFSTHDASLLNHLNRDEVWFTEKQADGSTRLGALAEFAGERVRKSVNLESGYLSGRFGAVPELNKAEVLRTLHGIG
jgi:hypothetical protein